MQRAATAYLQTQVTTTSQGDIVIMLFDGALKFLNQAKELLAKNDMAGKGLAISRTLDIINELDSTLNMEKGGAVAANLHGLYVFCTNHLVRANLKKDAKMVDEVLNILSGIRGAWAEIVSLPEAQAAAQEAAANMRANTSTPSRPQAGTTSNGAPAPGASARIRATYAKQNEEQLAAVQATAAPEENAAPTEVKATVAAAAPGAAPATEPPVTGFNPAMGRLGGMQAKTDLYRRFSGQ